MGVYLNHQGVVKYLTGSKIAELLQSIAKTCHPDLTKEEISCFSSRSGRVWAVVLLDEAGMNPDFIKSRLRWLGDSYRVYLRDMAVLQMKHIAALNNHRSISFHCTEIIVLHSQILSLKTTTWDLIKRMNINLVSLFLFLLHACNT
jgi:hypothetical protein